MHHTGGPAKPDDALIEIGLRQIHREEAMLHMFYLNHSRSHCSQAPVQALFEKIERERRRMSKRCFLHKVAPRAQIHRIEKSRWPGSLNIGEMLIAIIHQAQLVRGHRRMAKPADDPVRRLIGHRIRGHALHECSIMSTRINYQPGL
jgi:hypothetical protein